MNEKDFFIEIHAVEHCNLKCARCSHFSPLAEEEVCEINSVTQDVTRVMNIVGNRVKGIHIMGGEPLLHPNLNMLLYSVRQVCGHNINIELVTNGILLSHQNELFWNTCRENDIIIRPTIYNIDVKYTELEKYAEERKVKLMSYSRKNEIKAFKTYPLDIYGKQNPVNSFDNCSLACKFLLVKKGKVFPCSIMGNIEHFNNYFGLQLKITKDDYIDLYEVRDSEEFVSQLYRLKAFCRYCNVDKRRQNVGWGLTEYSIKEWTE